MYRNSNPCLKPPQPPQSQGGLVPATASSSEFQQADLSTEFPSEIEHISDISVGDSKNHTYIRIEFKDGNRVVCGIIFSKRTPTIEGFDLFTDGSSKGKLNLETLQKLYSETNNSKVKDALYGLIVMMSGLKNGVKENKESFTLHKDKKVISIPIRIFILLKGIAERI
eukprot:GHVP01036944.1.p1 GENE.GHVP01036944.1~~GHVP01036944.1.p1  ORF type:complete len:168 (-),score=33.43 GHVP01036944.1:703-1206(-)